MLCSSLQRNRTQASEAIFGNRWIVRLASRILDTIGAPLRHKTGVEVTAEVMGRIERARRERADSLNLNDLGLELLPPELWELTHLTSLYLRDNGLSVLPPEIGQLTWLTTLDLSRNGLSVLPPEIGQLTRLTTLDLGNNGLSVLPEEMAQLTRLTDLYLRDNGLSVLPEVLWELTQLTTLTLDTNGLSVLPAGIGQLTRLTTLDLGRNELSVLPEEMGQLTRLTDLYLGDNGLSVLPEVLWELTQLTTLDLDNNALLVLPPWLWELTRLTTLYLSGNGLSVLPEEIGQLTRLTTLSLDNNRLSELPNRLGDLIDLRALDVFKNPLVYPPEEVCAGGTAAIQAFLRACAAEGTVQQWNSKLLILGEATVGKTTLFKQLTGGKYDAHESQTHGIHIGRLQLEHPQVPETVMDLTAWDFGGQLEYRATQRFYLTDRSLFLLVWNTRARHRDGKLMAWLDTITARAPQSPILIVGTHADDASTATLPENLRERYPQIVGVFQADALTGTGIQEVRDAVRAQAAGLPLMGVAWPRSWVRAAEAVRGLDGLVVSATVMREAMRAAGVDDPDAQATIARTLHDLGEIVHFADDAELSRRVVLRPAWLDERITQVLDSPAVAQARGVLSRAERRRLWAGLDDLDMDDRLVRMMERFDLAYQVGDRDQSQDVALIVERLGEVQPATIGDLWEQAAEDGREVGVVFKLKSRQAGIPTWFIARMHRYSAGLHWSHGVLLNDRAAPHTSWALLVDDEREQPTISLRVRGRAPVAFLHVLMEAFRNIVSSRYPGLIEKVLVPCQCGDEAGALCGHLFDLVDLQDEAEDPDSDGRVRCQVTKRKIDAARMLYGLPGSNIARGIEQVRDQLQRGEQATLEVLVHVQALSQDRAQSGIVCPSLFDVEDLGESRVLRRRRIRLRLWCEWPYPGPQDIGHPGGPHPLPGEDGVYLLKELPEGIRRYLPYLRLAAAGLGAIAPVITPSLFAATAELADQIQQGLDTTEKVLDMLGDGPASLYAAQPLGRGSGGPQRLARTPADFRSLRAALSGLDPDQRWGGLETVPRPEDQAIIFVCPAHRRALQHPYDPR